MATGVKVDRDEYIRRAVLADAHLGASVTNEKMQKYVHSRTQEGINIINLGMTYEKMLIAVRILAAVKNPHNICVIGSKDDASRAIVKFCHYTGATPVPGRWTPGTLTNQITKSYMEPRIVLVTNAAVDQQAISECAYANIAVIALCNTDTKLKYVDCAIPVNTNSHKAVSLTLWALARMLLRVNGSLSYDEQWTVQPSAFNFREVDESRANDDGFIVSDDELEEETTGGDNGQWADAQDWEVQ